MFLFVYFNLLVRQCCLNLSFNCIIIIIKISIASNLTYNNKTEVT